MSEPPASRQMTALVFDGEASIRSDYPTPKPRKGEALVEVRIAGVCSTDLEILRGYMGFRGVMGHEFVGRVVEGPGQWLDKRVVAEINCVCGQCPTCRSGLQNHCPNRSVLGISGRDGAFAQYVAVPVRNLHEVPEGVSDDEAVFVEPLAAAFQIARQIKLSRSDSLVVLGDGRLGQLVVRALKPLVGTLLLVGKHTTKLEAAEKQGVQTKLVRDFVPENLADVVVDATGRPGGLELAVNAVRPRGTIVLKSTFAGTEGVDLCPVVVNEVTVVGSRCGPFDQAIKALAAKQVDVSALVSRRFALRDGPAALEAAAKPDTIKVLIDVR